MDKFKAITTLYPNAASIALNADGTIEYVHDAEGNNVLIDTNAVDSWVDPEEYKMNRAKEYPPIGDQLDALFHAGVFPADMTATIQAVKDKYPK